MRNLHPCSNFNLIWYEHLTTSLFKCQRRLDWIDNLALTFLFLTRIVAVSREVHQFFGRANSGFGQEHKGACGMC